MEMSQKSQTDMQVEEVELLRQQLQVYQADFDMERRERLEIKHKVITSLLSHFKTVISSYTLYLCTLKLSEISY